MKYLTIVLAISLTGFACSSSSSSDGESTATINGSVEESQQQKLKQNSTAGVIVTAGRVNSNGSVEAINGVQTETNASGNFSLEVDAESTQHLVIMAENQGTTWKGYLSGEIENGNSYTLKPINSESSAEAEIFANLVASGGADIVNKADVESTVSSEVATEIQGNTSTASTIAAGLINAAEARAEFYSEMMSSNAQAALEATSESMSEAQFRLESELDASTSAEQRADAYNVFVESVVNAYLNAGLDASSSAKAIEVWSRTYVNSTASTSSEVRESTRKNTSLLVASAIDGAIRTEAEASGMSESSIQAIVDSGVQLRSEIKASSGVDSEIKAAFETYHEEVRTTMENDGSFEASVIVEIDSKINASGGAKATFETAVSALTNASIVVNVYQTFYAGVRSTVETMLSGASEAEINAVTELMILANVAS
ncbi:hypothetical protein [Gracilimonas sp.]|uniref:hypothetical protein n=1 Tax=Gracilimonas sp. TaxID=1974203 RepID=UPI003750C2DF